VACKQEMESIKGDGSVDRCNPCFDQGAMWAGGKRVLFHINSHLSKLH
jgi:hypothetical protein